jgi:hypothetical protein
VSHAGGILGHDATSSSAYRTRFVNCFNMGCVGHASSIPSSTAGGILGLKSSTAAPAYFANCYNLGKVNRAASSGSMNVGSIVGSIGTNVFAVNTYFLSGTRAYNGIPQVDQMSGGASSQQPTMDGASSPARTAAQASGAKTLDLLQPLMSDLQDGTSTYYTGSTTANGETFAGFDFDAVWKGTHCIGSPYLRSIGKE